MTAVEIRYRYTTPPTEPAISALASVRCVYGIRSLTLNSEARTLRVEFDSTRLNAATVASLIRATGLEFTEELAAVFTQAPVA
jgi:hypothetical protein